MNAIKKLTFLLLFFIMVKNGSSQNVFPSSSSISVQKGNVFYKSYTLQVGNASYNWYLGTTNGLSVNVSSGFLGNNQTVLITLSGSNNFNTDFTQTYNFPVYFVNTSTNITQVAYFSLIVNYYVGCQEEITITQNVSSGVTSNQSAEITLTATNTISNGANANYDAGERVYLKPGFNVYAGGVFTGFIEGCAITSNRSSTFKEKDDVEKENTFEINTVQIYPNPTKGISNLISNQKINAYALFNTQGSFLISKSLNKDKTALNLEELPSGIYFLKVFLESGEVLTKKIVKE